jgi:hypothetical protein
VISNFGALPFVIICFVTEGATKCRMASSAPFDYRISYILPA